MEKGLKNPLVRDTNLTLEKEKGGSEFCLARLNSIQIDRFPEQTEKEFVEMAQIIAIQ
ncbi:hypothetical protein N9M73_06530 [Rhodobacteraceae bacterium]|nr:hypothetical protein [Paracoccaceae bacterium]